KRDLARALGRTCNLFWQATWLRQDVIPQRIYLAAFPFLLHYVVEPERPDHLMKAQGARPKSANFPAMVQSDCARSAIADWYYNVHSQRRQVKDVSFHVPP